MCARKRAARTLNEYWCSDPENTGVKGELRIGTTLESELHSQPVALLSTAGAQITRERAQNVQECVCAPVRARRLGNWERRKSLLGEVLRMGGQTPGAESGEWK